MVKTACLGKIWFSRYLGPSQGRGRCRALRDHFSNANISGTKRANRNPIGFSKSRKMDLSDHLLSNFAYLYSFTPKIGTENRVRAVLEFGEKLRVFLLLPNPLLDFFDLLKWFRRYHWAPFGENRMSKWYLVLQLWAENSKIGNFGPVFQMRISRERKEQTEIRLDFHNDQRQYFLNAICQI